MFTGLIEEVGRLAAVHTRDGGTELQLTAPEISRDAAAGDSIAVNGCCLTISSRETDCLTFDLLEETIARTNLLDLPENSLVNLERALRADSRIAGHFVQGHVDCVARIVAFAPEGADFRLEVELPEQFRHYVVSKGSIAIDGISLTVADVLARTFVVWIIPYTKQHTNLQTATVGDSVNLEFDVLAKYVEKMIQPAVMKE
jgi:riboflavin synthase